MPLSGKVIVMVISVGWSRHDDRPREYLVIGCNSPMASPFSVSER